MRRSGGSPAFRSTIRIHDASELYEDAVAGALHCAAMMRGDGGIDQIAPQPAQSRKGAILIGASKPAVSD